MATCIENIAGSIRPNCAHPLTAGYTGRGVLIPYSAITALVQNSDNPRIVESVTAGTVVEIDNTAVTSQLSQVQITRQTLRADASKLPKLLLFAYL